MTNKFKCTRIKARIKSKTKMFGEITKVLDRCMQCQDVMEQCLDRGPGGTLIV